MTQSLHPAAKQGFSKAAKLYQQVRPDYPTEIIAWLQQHLMLDPTAHLVDLGAGTGKFLPYLQALSSHISAVEPVDEMREELQQQHPDVSTFANFSHALDFADESVDAIFCAQSFHWFANLETLKELHRVLKPQGYLVLIWNQRDIQVDWVKALAELILPLEGDTPRYHSGQWQKVLQQQSLFQALAEQCFEQKHHGTVEEVVSKRLLSTSFIAALPVDQQQKLKRQFEQIVQHYTTKQADQVIDFPYRTQVYVFQKNLE